MKKTLKKLAAVCMAAVMMANLLGAIVFASDTKSSTVAITESTNIFDYEVIFEDVMNPGYPGGSFNISTSASYKITFSPSYGGIATYVEFYKVDDSTDQPFLTLHMPAYTLGMPSSLTTYFPFDKGEYYAKVKPEKNGIPVSGKFRVYGVASVNRSQLV